MNLRIHCIKNEFSQTNYEFIWFFPVVINSLRSLHILNMQYCIFWSFEWPRIVSVMRKRIEWTGSTQEATTTFPVLKCPLPIRFTKCIETLKLKIRNWLTYRFFGLSPHFQHSRWDRTKFDFGQVLSDIWFWPVKKIVLWTETNGKLRSLNPWNSKINIGREQKYKIYLR